MSGDQTQARGGPRGSQGCCCSTGGEARRTKNSDCGGRQSDELKAGRSRLETGGIGPKQTISPRLVTFLTAGLVLLSFKNSTPKRH